jgi:hypothetical protein
MSIYYKLYEKNDNMNAEGSRKTIRLNELCKRTAEGIAHFFLQLNCL